ncbi:hypothetical protein [Microcoleus vaginatus]|uniref:hypothetical protein n=1 Tax=Microcoleus vaginatus TaxID=119532 RepID=UPI00020D2A1C|nr:hypothetical protein MicvaDRAFT_0805 [Microcoleus vaginatus FGP-2]
MTNSLFRLLSILLTIAVITLFPGVANAGQISVHNSTNQSITCDASGGIRNTVKQNMQRILLSSGQTLALNPQDCSTQTSIAWSVRHTMLTI